MARFFAGSSSAPSSALRVPLALRGLAALRGRLERRLPVKLRRLVLALLVGFTLTACSPKMPTVTPQAARVLWVSPTGVRLAIDVDVQNPNSFPLFADAIEGVIEIGAGNTLGHGLAYPRGTIPAEGASRLTTQLDVQWTHAGALAPFLMSSGPVPYVFKGNARIGGDGLNLAVPFQVNGQLTRAELLGAGLRGL